MTDAKKKELLQKTRRGIFPVGRALVDIADILASRIEAGDPFKSTVWAHIESAMAHVDSMRNGDSSEFHLAAAAADLLLALETSQRKALKQRRKMKDMLKVTDAELPQRMVVTAD